MALYLRLLGTDPVNPKIPIHAFQALAAEWARGNLTAAQANTIVGILCQVSNPDGSVTPKPLTAAEQTEAQTLVTTVTSIPITGSATAIADGRARRALRIQEIDQVLLLVDTKIAPYDTEAAIKTRLGV